MRPSLEGASWDLAAASAAEGDRAALKQLLGAIRPMVVHRCRAELGISGADAVAEDVCRSILTALPHREDRAKSFLHFVYEATGQVVERVRAQSARSNVPVLAHGGTAKSRDTAVNGIAPRFVDGDATHRMRELLAMLPVHERDVLILRLLGGLNAAETATALGSTPGTVRLDQHRAMNTLRGRIADA